MFEKLELEYWEARLLKEPNNQQILKNIEYLKKRVYEILQLNK